MCDNFDRKQNMGINCHMCDKIYELVHGTSYIVYTEMKQHDSLSVGLEFRKGSNAKSMQPAGFNWKAYLGQA